MAVRRPLPCPPVLREAPRGQETAERTIMTTKIKAAYFLTKEAQARLVLARQKTTRRQVVEFDVDANMALEEGVISIDDDGDIDQNLSVMEHLLSRRSRTKSEIPAGILEWCISDEMDHILSTEQAQKYYDETIRARIEKRKEIEVARRGIRTLVDTYLSSILLGEGMILDSNRGNICFEVNGVLVDAKWVLTPLEIDTVCIEARRREKIANDAKCCQEKATNEAALAAKEKEEKDRRDWILSHGSPRLQKALEAGMIDVISGLYRTERIKHDFSEKWFDWHAIAENEHRERINPKENELDALLLARAKWPDAGGLELCSVRCCVGKNGQWLPSEHTNCEHTNWEPALMVVLPWDISHWAIMFINRV